MSTIFYSADVMNKGSRVVSIDGIVETDLTGSDLYNTCRNSLKEDFKNIEFDEILLISLNKI